MDAATLARAALGVGLALNLALGPGPAAAANANDTPATAVVLSGTVSGDVAAAPPQLGSGRQAFLRFEYPGDGSRVALAVDITPGDPVSASHAGFNVYGPTAGRLYAEGGQTGQHPSHAVDLSSSEAGTYLIEVFNYNVTPIHYQASATGLPPQPVVAPDVGAAPAAQPTAAASEPVTVGVNVSPDRAADLDGPVSAVLAGGASGGSHFYRLAYPGDGSRVRIDLTVSPSDAETGGSSGFVVYGPTAGLEYARGVYQGGAPTHSAELSSNEPGTYVFEVFNTGARAIGYRLTATR
jgi:hypothetical protein